MNSKQGKFLVCVIVALGFCACNNFFHDLIPPDDNLITSFEIDGQIGAARIGSNTIDVMVEKETDLSVVIPRISVSQKASLLPITLDYVRAAFPGVDLARTAIEIYTTNDLYQYVGDLIRENHDFNVPALTLAMDFNGPVRFLVVGGQGGMRQYTVNVEIDSGEPKLLGFSFAKYDNPELMGDARCVINENELMVNALAVYPTEMDNISYALSPSFQILGERLEIDGVEIDSGETEVQFAKILGTQTKTITVWRDGESKEYALTVTFTEDPDTIRSITDFRFNKTDNPFIAANAVASIVNTENTGTITVQVYYSGAKPSSLIPRFITPGTASVGGITQASGSNSHDFSLPIEYRVVSRNGQYMRLYTVKVEFVGLANTAPRMTSFRFNQNLNHDLVQDTVAEISDGLIMIDVYYGSIYAPDTLIPEFTAGGIVSVSGSVQISGSSPQNFQRQIKYTVTNPENPMLTRDYWVQTRMTRDTSSDARIISFGFYPEDNSGLDDEIIAKVDQSTGKINVFAPVGSGVTSRSMYPRFEAVGQVNVDGIVQSSGNSPQTFDTTIVYTVVSANGKNSRNYEVIVRELRSTIFVDCNAYGYNDGTSWQDAFISLNAACSAAAQFPEDVPKEIWIAAGTYKPGVNTEDYFLLIANTSYIGGFVGNETAKSQRNVESNKVIISGDLGGGRYSNNLFGAFDNTTAVTLNGDLCFEDLTLENARAVMTGNRNSGTAINAVLVNGAELKINGCSFNDFTANGNGGAVYVSGGNAGIVDTIIENIQANNGAIYHSSGALTVDNLTLRNITGRGIYKINGGSVLLSSINASGISSDAISCSGINSGSVTLDGYSTFINTGRVYISSSVPVQVADTEIRNNAGSYALYVSSGSRTTTIERITVDGVANGMGIYANSTNLMRISGSQIRNCTNDYYGGGISLSGSGDKEISGVIIENCTAGYYGGGIYDSSSLSLSISNTIIKNAVSNYGGGLFIDEYTSRGKVVITGSRFENCTARYGGGTNIRYAESIEISNVIIENCTTTQDGGGIHLTNVKNIEINNANIKNCTAGGNGGGLYCDLYNGNLAVSKSRFENCTARHSGAIMIMESNEGYIIDTDFLNCNSQNDAKILNAGFVSIIRNCTFTHDNNLVNMGSPSIANFVSAFDNDGGNFDRCTFNNLKGNFAGENYIFNYYRFAPNTSNGSLVDPNNAGGAELTLRNCTFNVNAGSAGLMALFTGGSMPDLLLMDGCSINYSGGGQQPLIWLNGNNPTGRFRFSRNNYYNGTLLDTAEKINGLGTAVIRRTQNAVVTMVP